MKKTESKISEIEKNDFMSILMDNSSNQLEDQFFLSKKKMLNAQVYI